ncbi:ABC transporter ATP-binding protein [Pleomorphovibrio marinus]|uniref:ABC transporter ATP-binding protein n=1 Tax=Pleomorphovibrio marinus TaxID=2164132 RepID=UPI000E0C0F22|nr:ABC transporter ATP-binding protein [Pleomorphovibrio marinus]
MEAYRTILQANGLSIGYHQGKKKLTVAKDLNFNLEKGLLTCILGPNGVGKSTLLKTILGILPAISGDIKLFNQPLEKYSSQRLAKTIAIVLTERPPGGNLTVEQLVGLGRIPHTGWLGVLSQQDKKKIDTAIRLTKIEPLRKRRMGELSDGQIQIAMIARALAQDGDILILDEPTAHLDLANRWEIIHLLRRLAQISGKAILMVTHDLDQALENSDQLWLMPPQQEMIGGPPEDLLIQGKLDLLLPTGSLALDRETGKLFSAKSSRLPPFTGSPKYQKWAKNFLRKIPHSAIESFHLEDNPFSIQIAIHGKTQYFESFEHLRFFLLQH